MTKAKAKRRATTRQPASKLAATRSVKAKQVGTKTKRPAATRVLPAADSSALPRKAPGARADSKQARVLALLRSTNGCTSLAHGGKDRHPHPVPIKVFDETIRVMKSAVQKAKLGRDEEMQALKRLDSQARRLEGLVEGPSLGSFVAGELAASPALGGRSVFGWEADAPIKATSARRATKI